MIGALFVFRMFLILILFLKLILFLNRAEFFMLIFVGKKYFFPKKTIIKHDGIVGVIKWDSFVTIFEKILEINLLQNQTKKIFLLDAFLASFMQGFFYQKFALEIVKFTGKHLRLSVFLINL